MNANTMAAISRGVARFRLTTAVTIGVVFLSTAITFSVSAADKPRVASINNCTDQMALLLADPDQIVSLTFLSQQKVASVYRDKALSYPTNTGAAEEVLALEPDLVLAGAYTSKYTIQLLQKAGVRVETINIANSVEDVMLNVSMVGDWLEQRQVAEEIIDDMKTRLARLPDAPSVRPVAAIYDPNGYTVGANTLRGQMLELAGWHNAASDRGVLYYGTLSLESILKLDPDILVSSPYSAETWSRAQALNRHPALAQSGIGADVVHIPSAMTICGGPWSVDVIELLARERTGYLDN